MKRRIAPAIAIGAALLASSLGLAASTAGAATGTVRPNDAVRSSTAAMAHSKPAAPPFEVCTDRGSNALCIDRFQGGTRAGTALIGWPPGSDNNNFLYVSMSGMCNHGEVSANLECPFTPNRGLNARYDGARIVEILNNNGLCVADSGTGSSTSALEACPPNTNGAGGADGTIFILAQSGDPTYVVNRYWSDLSSGGNGYNPRWMCIYLKASPVWIGADTASAGTCQFNGG